MGFFDRLFGTRAEAPAQARVDAGSRSTDEIAVERYHYLLRTAPPETIESVHREAFSKLTPEQRDLLFTELTKNAPAGDAPKANDAASLATSATRSELRQPGTMERSMTGGGQGMGFGGMLGSSLLGTVAGYVIGSAIVSSFLPIDDGSDASADASGDGDASAADASGTADTGADASAADYSSADGGFGDGGFDGGGDFGGGADFGGGFDF